jgi:hypothetical protein
LYVDLDAMGFDEGSPEQNNYDGFQDLGNRQMPPERAVHSDGTPVGLVTSLHLSPSIVVVRAGSPDCPVLFSRPEVTK